MIHGHLFVARLIGLTVPFLVKFVVAAVFLLSLLVPRLWLPIGERSLVRQLLLAALGLRYWGKKRDQPLAKVDLPSDFEIETYLLPVVRLFALFEREQQRWPVLKAPVRPSFELLAEEREEIKEEKEEDLPQRRRMFAPPRSTITKVAQV